MDGYWEEQKQTAVLNNAHSFILYPKIKSNLSNFIVKFQEKRKDTCTTEGK